MRASTNGMHVQSLWCARLYNLRVPSRSNGGPPRPAGRHMPSVPRNLAYGNAPALALLEGSCQGGCIRQVEEARPGGCTRIGAKGLHPLHGRGAHRCLVCRSWLDRQGHQHPAWSVLLQCVVQHLRVVRVHATQLHTGCRLIACTRYVCSTRTRCTHRALATLHMHSQHGGCADDRCLRLHGQLHRRQT